MPVSFPFQLGALGPLHVRHEHMDIGLHRAIVLLYASDLHLGWPWSNALTNQLIAAARNVRPDIIVLGGDLSDTAGGLPRLRGCVMALARIAPVYALAGNHDHRLGVERVQRAVIEGGGMWLADPSCNRVMDCGVELHLPGDIAHCGGAARVPRILCGHDPAVFPAAASAGYRLVLAGHLHGGQCVLWTRHGRLYPGAWFARWTGLRFSEGDTTMIVSRGAADSLPFRWNCPREIIACRMV